MQAKMPLQPLLINTQRLLATFLLTNTLCLLANIGYEKATKSLSSLPFALDPWNFHSAELQREEKINEISGAVQLSSQV